jgi:putative nucleotidyltransferase with HDIG domain
MPFFMPILKPLNPIEVKSRLKKGKSLPTLPVTFMKIMNVTSDPNNSFTELANLIAYDPVVTADVLQVANSSYMGLRAPAEDLSTAILYLGTAEIRRIAIAVGAFNIFSKSSSRSYIQNVWRHSLTTGLISQQLAAFCGFDFYEDAYVAGLLHDLGKVFFASSYSDIYQPILEKVSGGNMILELEKQTFGMTHLDAALELCQYWRLPPKVCNVATNHHNPNECSSEADLLSLCVACSNIYAHMIIGDEPVDSRLPQARQWLGEVLENSIEGKSLGIDGMEGILLMEAAEFSTCPEIFSLH